NCRMNSKLPDYEDYNILALKSLGHVITPLLLLMHLGYKADSKEVKGTIQFFKHFLIARQLNDDAHDWQSDLKKGCINSVCAILLKDSKNNRKISKLEKIFWDKTILRVSKIIQSHIAMAKGVLDSNTFIKENNILQSLLAPIEISVAEAL